MSNTHSIQNTWRLPRQMAQIAIYLVLAATSMFGQTYRYWDSNGNGNPAILDGTGTWNVSGSKEWYNGTTNANWNNSAGWTAVLGNGGTAGTVTVSSTIIATGIVFEPVTGSYTLAGTMGLPLQLGSGGITANDSVTITTDIQLNAAQSWTVAGGQSVQFSGTIIGSVGLQKNGTGTLIFTAASPSMSGTVTVGAGKLSVTNTSGSATGTGSVIIGNGGTLEGTGFISGLVQVQSGGIIAPGVSSTTGIGTLTLGSSSVAAGGSINLGISSTGSFDRLVINNNLSMSTSGAINLTLNAGFTPAAGQSFDLVDWGSLSFGGANLASTLSLPDISAYNLAWDSSAFHSTGTVSIVAAVPEPGRVLLTGLGLCATLLRRRRVLAR